MNIKENFKCPHCSGRKINLDSAAPMLANVLLINMTCSDCGTQWRVYMQAADITSEIVNVPAEQNAETLEPVSVEADAE